MTATSSDLTTARFAQRDTAMARIQHLLHSRPWISSLVIVVLTLGVFGLVNPRFLAPVTLSLLVQQTAVVAALAVGQTLIVLVAGIDLSVGTIAILAMMVMAKLSSGGGVPAPLAVLAGVGVGVICGLANGVLVTRMKLPPFIVTLGTMSVFTAIALLYTGGTSIEQDQLPSLLNLTGQTIGHAGFTITYGVLIVAVIYLVVGFALGQTAWGRHLYAVGGDAEAARLAGVRVNRVLLSVYLVAGVVYAVGAWVLIGRASGASPNAAVNVNLDTITAVVIGGTSLFGGRGTLVGSLLGALIVQSFAVGLALAGVDEQFRLLAVGVLVLAAVSIDQWIRKVR